MHHPIGLKKKCFGMNNYGKAKTIWTPLTHASHRRRSLEKYDLCKVVSEGKHSTEEYQAILRHLLSKYDLLFDGNLVTCKSKPVDIYIQLYANPQNTKLYSVPKVHKSAFNKEV